MADDNKEENSLVPIGSNALVRVGNAIGITNKLLAELEHRKSALTQLSGQLKWKFQTEGSVTSLVIMDGVVYFGSEGCLYALDSQSGQLKWKFQTESQADLLHITMNNSVAYFEIREPLWEEYGHYEVSHWYAVDSQSGQLKWKFQPISVNVTNTIIIIMDGVVYFGSEKYLYAVDSQSGQLKWQSKDEDTSYSSPIIKDGVIYFETYKILPDNNDYDYEHYRQDLAGYLYAVDSQSGQLKWKFQAEDISVDDGGMIPEVPIIMDKVIYFSCGGYLYAVDSQSGQLEGKFQVRNWGVDYSFLVITDKVVYFGIDAYLYAVDSQSGELKWKFTAEGRIISSSMIDGVVYFGAGKDLYAVDAQSGQLKWIFKDQDGGWISPSPIIMIGNVICFMNRDYYLYGVDNQSGQLKWKFQTEDRHYREDICKSPIIIMDGVVYFGSKDKYLYAVDSQSGELKWKFKTDRSYSSNLAIMDGVVYFGSNDKYLYAVHI